MVLSSALALHALAAGGGARVYVFGDRRGTDKADGSHLRVIAESVHGIAAAINEIHDAFWQAGFLEQLERAAHRKGNALGRFQDERVAAGDGVRQEPVSDHRGKVEWH